MRYIVYIGREQDGDRKISINTKIGVATNNLNGCWLVRGRLLIKATPHRSGVCKGATEHSEALGAVLPTSIDTLYVGICFCFLC